MQGVVLVAVPFGGLLPPTPAMYDKEFTMTDSASGAPTHWLYTLSCREYEEDFFLPEQG